MAATKINISDLIALMKDAHFFSIYHLLYLLTITITNDANTQERLVFSVSVDFNKKTDTGIILCLFKILLWWKMHKFTPIYNFLYLLMQEEVTKLFIKEWYLLDIFSFSPKHKQFSNNQAIKLANLITPVNNLFL